MRIIHFVFICVNDNLENKLITSKYCVLQVVFLHLDSLNKEKITRLDIIKISVQQA